MDCTQVESGSLRCTASIFLTLWVFDDQQGQTMEASNQGGYSLPRTFDSTVKGA